MLNQTPETSGAIGCKSRLLFANIAMVIWFQVSGFRCQEACSVFYRPQDPLRPYNCYWSPRFPLNPET